MRSNYDKLAVKTVSGLKSLNVNLINNFASRKNKLRSSSTIFQVEPKYLHKPSALTLLLILSGDVECNPGPKNASVFPCGHCERPVSWSHLGVCCDECGIWHHKSCEDISTKEMEYLERSNVVWYCCKCESVNIDSFTFNSYELHTTNMFSPLSGTELSIDSLNSSTPFSPLHASSPRNQKPIRASRLSTRSDTASSVSSDSKSSSYHHMNNLPHKQSNLRLLTVNCCSIREHKQEFTAALDYVKPDIICGTESWLKGIKPGVEPSKSAIKSSEIFPDNFIFHRNDRMSRGGGVFTGVSNNLIANEQAQLVTDCEIEWTKVKLKNNKDLYLSSFYMPHRNLEDLNNLNLSLKKLSEKSKNKRILLAGDFNCPDIDWETLSVHPNASDRDVQQTLIDISVEHGLTQVHNQPTRQDNILDLVFTNNSSLIKSSNSIPGISDHAMVVTDSDVKPLYNRQKSRKVYLFSKANWDEINQSCVNLSTKINIMANTNNINTLWETFKTEINTAMETHIPSKIFKNKNSVPWFNRKLKRMLDRKGRLYNHAKKSKQWSEFKNYQKLCKREFKKAEIDYVNKTIQQGLEKHNNKPFWRYVKAKRQDNIGTAPLKRNGNLISESKEKAQILIEQFSSVFTKNKEHNIPKLNKLYKSNIGKITITIPGIEKLLNKINTSKAKGPDNISNIILKNCAKQLAPGLRTIFQHSIDSGDLPDDWINANISPVFKKGDVHLAENYRPVSLTSVACKLLEHVICKHLLNHLERNKILTNLNHGFRSGYSCETQLLVTLNELLNYNDTKSQTDIVILDFSKAFDTVPHEELLCKLDSYGINGPIHRWLRTFLTKRHMRVVVDGESSNKVTVDSGVPQGTVLGPLLFLCHINDLPQSVKSKVRLFADDCLLYRKIETQHDHLILQKDLYELEIWAKKWGMRFNAKKCYIMSINNKSSHFYELDNHILKQVNENPYLGLTISDDLKWSSHITKMTKKANSTMAFLRRNLRNFPEDCRKTAYLSLVRSILDYGSIIWDPYLLSDIDKIERVQRQAARFITGDYKTREEGCVTKMLENLALRPLQERRSASRLIFLYKVVEGLVPAIPPDEYLKPAKHKRRIKTRQYSDFQSSNIIDRHIVNHNKGFIVPNCNTEQRKNFFFIKTTVEWNHLDCQTVGASTIEGFKSALQQCD